MLSTEDKLTLEKELIQEKTTQASLETMMFIPPASTSNEKKPTLLLVEDNADLRQYIQILLSPHYHLIATENGKEALEWLTADGGRQTAAGGKQATKDIEEKNQPKNPPITSFSSPPTAHHPPSAVHRLPSLIISDIMMPIMDGYEFLETLKSHDVFRYIPVIMLTARAESRDRLKALRIGVDDYIIKPFDEEELLVRIENLLANVSSRIGLLNTTIPKETSTPPPPLMSQEDSEWLEKLETYILQTIGQFDVNSEQIAQELFISRTQLFKRVKRLTGLTLSQYIKQIRLEKARMYLTNRKYSTIKQVAYAVGLKDAKTFSQNFKKRYGKLPSEYL